MLEKYLFSSFIIPEGVSMWESLVFIDCGKMLSRVGSIRFLTCFHKYELVLFSAIDFENKSFLALRISVEVLLRQTLQLYTGSSFYVYDMHHEFLLHFFISSVNQSG